MSPMGVRFQPVLAAGAFVSALVFVVLVQVDASVTQAFAGAMLSITIGFLLSLRFDDYEDSDLPTSRTRRRS